MADFGRFGGVFDGIRGFSLFVEHIISGYPDCAGECMESLKSEMCALGTAFRIWLVVV